MAKISAGTRRELVQALSERYRSAAKTEKRRILDEFVALTRYHRKHAIRVSSLPGDRYQRHESTASSALRRGGPRGIGDPLGGVRPRVRQATQTTPPRAAPGTRAIRPPQARRARSRPRSPGQLRDNESGTRRATLGNAGPSEARAHEAGGPEERAYQDVRRLARPGAGALRDRPRRSLRRIARRKLRALVGAHRHRKRLDGGYSAAHERWGARR